VASTEVTTVSVDRWWRLYFNPEATAAWAPEQWATEFRAEARRLLFEHADRRERAGLDGEEALGRWQAASDITVRSETHRAGHDDWPVPGPMVTDLPGGHVGMAVEEVYELLRQQDFAPVALQGSGGHGSRRLWEEPSDASDALGRPEARLVCYRCARDAEQVARAKGFVAPDMVEWAAGFGRPAVDWRRTLDAAVSRVLAHHAGARDWSYSRPRRHGSSGPFILPGMVAPAQPHVVVVRDTSPSMTMGDDLLSLVTTEVGALLAEKARVTMVDTSSEAAEARRVTTRRQAYSAQRGQGTDMGAGLAAAANVRPKPHLVVVLTDGETNWPPVKPVHGCGVVVVVFGRGAREQAERVPSWARTVVVDKA
jgi:predicted metal-dependent peptidase